MKIYKSILLFILFSLFSCKSFVRIPPPPFSPPLENYRVTEFYAPSSRPLHQGIDLATSKGTPVKSAHEGRVIYAGNRLNFYGKTVVVEYSKNWSSLYAHLDKIKVHEGQRISRGHIIGTVGNTGNVTGVHLHFELIYKKQPIDPAPFLRIK